MGEDIGPGCRAAREPVHLWRRGGAQPSRACYAWDMDFRREALTDMAAEVRAGKRAARDLVTHALERIEALNPKVNAFVAVDPDGALEAAAAIDDAVAAGEDPGPLAGIP